MQKTMIWAVVLALVWCCVLAAAATGEEAEVDQYQREVIRIRVGPTLIDDPRNEDRTKLMTIPEFTYGVPFDVEVEWVEPTKGLQLMLSDFRIVSYNPRPKEGETYWSDDPGLELSVKSWDEENDGRISFASSKADEVVVGETRLLVTKKTVEIIMERKSGCESENLLVFFKKSVSDDSGLLFEIDPPWVGKPPVG